MAKTATKESTSNEAKTTGLLITRIQIKDSRAIINYHDDKAFSLNEGTYTGKDDCTSDFLQKFDSAKEKLKYIGYYYAPGIMNILKKLK